MLNIFKKSGITFSMENEKLKVEGLKKLPGHEADEIRLQIRQHKDEIIKELQNNFICAARCKTSGLCYAYAVFDAKPGQPKPCDPKDCKIKREREKSWIKRQPEKIDSPEKDKTEILEVFKTIEPFWKNKNMAQTLIDVARILKKEDVKLSNKKYEKFVHKIKDLLNPEIEKDKKTLIEIIENLAFLKTLIKDGQPVSINDFINKDPQQLAMI